MKKFITNLFDKEKVNFGRQYEIDLLRGFTVIVLIVCHVGLFLTKETTSFMFYFADLIGSEPAAPVFMVLMGISIIFSRRQSAGYFFKRGLILFVGGYLLNVYRSFPYWITGELDLFASLPGFFVVDIFQFAGLAFLLLAFLRKIKMPYWGAFLVSIVMLSVGTILMAIPNALNVPQEATYVLNHFLPLNNEYCCFNLLTWFIYPCFGLMLGELIIRCKNKDKFYLILLILGSIGVIALYLNIGLRFPNYVSYYLGGNYYRMGLINTLVTCLFSCFALAVWFYIGKVLPKVFANYLSFLSKNITFVYVASWIEIAALIHIQAYYKLDFPVIAIVGMMAAVLLTCSLLVIPYRKIRIKINSIKKAKLSS